jgi:xanthoxin dehydrogenase
MQWLDARPERGCGGRASSGIEEYSRCLHNATDLPAEALHGASSTHQTHKRGGNVRLSNKVAVITGGASGIGAASVQRFIDEGCRVVIGDIQRGPGEAFAARFGAAARFAVCDVTREEDVAALADLAVSEFGQLDIMFNNAGIVGAIGPIDTTPAAEWGASLDVLLNGVFYGMKHAARVMKPRGSGSIISMASTAGLMGGLGPHAYAAAKHAVVGLTKNVAAELCRSGIRVNAIAAASMATPMVANVLTGDPGASRKPSECWLLPRRCAIVPVLPRTWPMPRCGWPATSPATPPDTP